MRRELTTTTYTYTLLRDHSSSLVSNSALQEPHPFSHSLPICLITDTNSLCQQNKIAESVILRKTEKPLSINLSHWHSTEQGTLTSSSCLLTKIWDPNNSFTVFLNLSLHRSLYRHKSVSYNILRISRSALQYIHILYLLMYNIETRARLSVSVHSDSLFLQIIRLTQVNSHYLLVIVTVKPQNN